ncbi:hypothetical protein [Clostridium sp. DJ247]|nr:hypothetical protein [Clostridium sp. DJ247]MBC2581994.1 hypothetical protein [Clostridium sp. DJ247]
MIKSIDIHWEDEIEELAKALNQESLAREQYELNLAENYQQLKITQTT